MNQPLDVAWDGQRTAEPMQRSLPAPGVAPLCWSLQHHQDSAQPSELTDRLLRTHHVPCARPSAPRARNSGPTGLGASCQHRADAQKGAEKGMQWGSGRGLEGGSEWWPHPLAMIGRTEVTKALQSRGLRRVKAGSPGASQGWAQPLSPVLCVCLPISPWGWRQAVNFRVVSEPSGMQRWGLGELQPPLSGLRAWQAGGRPVPSSE